MEGTWIYLVIIAAIIVTVVPLAAVVLVSIASRSEDTARSLFGQHPGRHEAMARRLLGFRAQNAAVPRQRPVPRTPERAGR